jgi:hypothetical protein
VFVAEHINRQRYGFMHDLRQGGLWKMWLVPMHLAAGSGGYLLWAPINVWLEGDLARRDPAA